MGKNRLDERGQGYVIFCPFIIGRTTKIMDYYEILEINKGASEDVIKAAYKALAKKYHPDNK